MNYLELEFINKIFKPKFCISVPNLKLSKVTYNSMFFIIIIKNSYIYIMP